MNNIVLAYLGTGRFHNRQREEEYPHEYVTKALEIFEQLGALIEPDKVMRGLARLAQ